MNNSNFGYTPNLEGMESYLKENERNQKEYDGPTWWTIPQGMSSVRILPPWDPTGRVALPVYSHPIEFQGKGMKYKKYSWTCVNKTFGKPCNICEGLDSIRQAGVDVSEYEPTRRTFYYNAIVMYDPDFDRDFKKGKKPEDCAGVAPGTHVLMRSPKVVYDWIVSQITNPMIGDITNITTGCDIFITKEGSGLGTKYTLTFNPNGKQPVPQEYLDKIESLYNLDEIFSTGFEKEQVDELVNSLRRSAGAISQGMSNTLNTMGGYQTNPGNAITSTPPNQGTTVMPPIQSPQSQPFGYSIPKQSPFGGSITPTDTPPWEVPQNINVNKPENSTNINNTPPCYGQYNPSSVQCVTCPHEISCSRDSNK